MVLCTGTTPSKMVGFNYEHQCKLERDHSGKCVCIGCGDPFEPRPPLPVRLVNVTESATARVVPAEKIDPMRSLLAEDYMRWSGPKDLKKKP